jgi:hypothetical protein
VPGGTWARSKIQRPTIIDFADLAELWNREGKETAKKSLAERWRHCLPDRRFFTQILLPYSFLASMYRNPTRRPRSGDRGYLYDFLDVEGRVAVDGENFWNRYQ